MDTEYYDDIIIGSGKAGKTLAPALVSNGRKVALVERSSLNAIDIGISHSICNIGTRHHRLGRNTSNIDAPAANHI